MSSSRFTRRDALKTGAAAATMGAVITGFPALTRSAQQKKFLKPIVAGINGKEGDPTYTSISDVPRILREKYDIEVEFQIHPSSTLGTDLSQLDAVQTGFIDITSNVTTQFMAYDEAFAFLDLPYIVTGWDQYLRISKSDIWQQQAAKFESNVPVKVLPPVGAGGYRLLWNNKRPLHSPADVEGLKFRTVTSPIVIELVRNWGGNPTPVPWVETYTALQQGVVDGFHVQPIWTYKFKMYEVLKYATEVNAIFSVQFQVMNRNTWNAIPESIQGPMMLAFQEAADNANKADRESEDFFKGELRKAGMEIYTPSSAEAGKWQEKGREVWGSAGKGIDRSLIEKTVALS
ncbi:MAG: TRAP transporter substrate-binding protein [Proteobacteria bacterium]|nr:TRAP transporter substrate-binding protein [Pseudomonadota bacterium]MDA1057992.1 TRAP transporter substrate-binding protein [Pseudomonadota bacterium]